MSYQISREITDLRGEFEGGTSLSVDFYNFIRRGAENTLDNINPETLKRRTPLYGGLGKNLFIYYCPADLEVPSAIYTQPSPETRGALPKYDYVPPAQFFIQNKMNAFTIEYINGVRFIIFRHSLSLASVDLSDMDAIGSKVSDQTLTINDFNVFQGNAALQRTFSEESGTAFTTAFATDIITSTAHGLSDGDRIMVFSATTLPAGLSTRTVYFVRDATTNTFKVSLVSAGTALDITDDGTGIHKWLVATQNEISELMSSTVDISDLLYGVTIIPMVFDDAENISRVELVLEIDTANYYTLNSAQDSVGDNFIDGLNMVRFDMSKRTETGSVTDTAIAKWRLRVITKAGTSQTVIVDKLSVQKTSHYYIEYYSNRMFIDGTTNAWKETPVSGDSVRLNRDAQGVLHYETAILIAQGNSAIKVNRSSFDNLATQLARKYGQYWKRHPSSEKPLTYNTLEDVEDTLPDYMGENLQAEMDIDYDSLDLSTTNFVDNETPAGSIDGSNTAFTITNTPNPASSLLLWLNGVYQTQDVDYTLSGETITFTSAPSSLLSGTPFVAFYRWSSV